MTDRSGARTTLRASLAELHEPAAAGLYDVEARRGGLVLAMCDHGYGGFMVLWVTVVEPQ